ncbi:LysM domain-containing protein [Ruminiclostridium sufflavum DSM 19573]|uniref:LysM domain-containing protein n=1 Tax=Ruminiclostridium sufflavum DSM 19573 TaxID=1121337 RepID=A0A318XJP0_9FIRM|nr:LysM peptidoglycan-binding domain-containing protein [Ruminiclostridium sufflavum]PYG87540.1 LysM domain-containing protein [Ruminiclostridium sufflavum DSM 19573]
MKKKYILRNKRRFFGFLFFLSFVSFIMIYANAVSGYKESNYRSIAVNTGDTLWSIAEKYGKDYDIREYIHSLKKINNLESSIIQKNTAILIPSNDYIKE